MAPIIIGFALKNSTTPLIMVNEIELIANNSPPNNYNNNNNNRIEKNENRLHCHIPLVNKFN